jgi:presenilin-like A22 family membrane protease
LERTLKDKFRAEPIYLLPVLASLLVGVVCASIVLVAPIPLTAVTPFPENTAGSLGNGLYFVVLAGVGASLIYLLLKRRKLKLVTLITGFAITAAAFLLSSVYLYAALSIFNVPYTTVLVLTLAVPITVLTDLAVFRARGRVYSLAILLLGGALGAFLGISIPILSAVLILSFLAAYDVFAVYRGPVGKIAQTGLEQLRGLSVSFRDVQIGLGDLTFYSMLTALVLINAGPVLCVASITGVLIGAYVALKMLERRGIFPGLPFPVALGLAPLIALLFH